MTFAGHHPNQCFCWGSTKLAQLSGGPFKAIKPTEDLARKENSRCKLSRQGGEEIFFFIFIYFPQFENIASGTNDVVIFNFLLGAYFYYKKIHPLPKHPKRTSMLRSLIFAMEHSQSKIGLLIILTFLCKIRIQCTKCVF